MNKFTDALVSPGKNPLIPEDKNWFGSLVGEWDFEWIDGHGTNAERHVKGEWIFSWVLEGTAIQDLFICPSREERIIKTYPDAEYGTTLRLYNPAARRWDIFYGCTGDAIRLEADKEDDRIVLTELSTRKRKWIFSDITDSSFHWEKFSTDEGEHWEKRGEVRATRRTPRP